MTSVGNLRVGIDVRTDKFRSNLKGATGHVKTFRSEIGNVSKSLVAFGAAAATAYITTKSGRFVREQMQAIDASAKFADRVGIAYEELQRLQHAGELTGVGAEKLNSSLEVMGKRLGEVAVLGKGSAKAALETLGLSAGKLAAMEPDQAFYKITSALEAVEGASKRAGIAAALFGRGNLAILQMTDKGTAGIRKMGAELDGLGGTISRIDAAKIEDANDALARLGRAATVTGGQIAVGLAPVLEAVAKSAGEEIPAAIGAANIAWLKFAKARADFELMGRRNNPFTSQDRVEEQRRYVAELAREIAEMQERFSGKATIGISAPRGLAKDITDVADALQFASVSADELREKLEFDIAVHGLSEVEKSIRKLAQAELAMPIIHQLDKLADKLDDLKHKAKVGDILKNLQMDAAKIGMNDRELLAFNLAFHDADDKEMKRAMGMFGEMEKAKKHAALEDKGREMFEATRRPIERFKGEIADAAKLLKVGLISEDVFDRRAAQLTRDTVGVIAPTLPESRAALQFPGAETYGSQAAASSIATARAPGVGSTEEKARQQREIANRRLDDIVSELREVQRAIDRQEQPREILVPAGAP